MPPTRKKKKKMDDDWMSMQSKLRDMDKLMPLVAMALPDADNDATMPGGGDGGESPITNITNIIIIPKPTNLVSLTTHALFDSAKALMLYLFGSH